MPTEGGGIVIGTRASALALWQARWVAGRLAALWPGLEISTKTFTTTGDRILDRPLPEIGGKGLFTEELEASLLEGTIDLAVHSLKDLPVEMPAGLALGALPERADARDVLISASRLGLSELPRDARVGSSSLRRAAQLLALRPDLEILPLRGNVDTRIEKAMRGDFDAIVLAAAGVTRLGRTGAIGSFLSFGEMLPAPGQGAIGVQCRSGDQATLRLLERLDDAATRAAVVAERGFLAGLGGGCSAPIAAFAEGDAASGKPGGLWFRGLVGSPDGKRLLRVEGRGGDAAELGARMAAEALQRGAGTILA